ncbi:MAG TPA: hypothetical protein PL143_09040 [Rhodocyclaceae bacterium]|nr:hypothetical protein [Rhodocyclaceae bacterium]
MSAPAKLIVTSPRPVAVLSGETNSPDAVRDPIVMAISSVAAAATTTALRCAFLMGLSVADRGGRDSMGAHARDAAYCGDFACACECCRRVTPVSAA